MAFVSKVGVSYANSNELYAKPSDGLHPLMLSAGWTVLDELDATVGSEDRVYHSDGEAGAEALFLRLTHDQTNSRIYFRAYGFWDEVNHNGYFEVGDGAGATAIEATVAGFTGWLAVDKDALGVVIKVGSDYRKFVGGKIQRVEPTELSGRTTLAAPVGGANEAGQNQLYVDADTDFTKFLPDERIWIVNQKIDSGVNAERAIILSVDAGSRTIFLTADLANSYDFGALVAQSPQPMMLWGDLPGQLDTADAYGLFGPDAYSARVKDWNSSLELFAGLDVDDYENLAAARAIFYELGPGKSHIYGSLNSRLLVVPLGSVSAEDTLSFEGTGHVIFPEVNKAFSLRVS